MKPVGVESNTYIGVNKKNKKENLNLKSVTLKEYQNIKTFLRTVPLQITLKKLLWLQKLNLLCHGHMLLAIVMVDKFLERFA